MSTLIGGPVKGVFAIASVLLAPPSVATIAAAAAASCGGVSNIVVAPAAACGDGVMTDLFLLPEPNTASRLGVETAITPFLLAMSGIFSLLPITAPMTTAVMLKLRSDPLLLTRISEILPPKASSFISSNFALSIETPFLCKVIALDAYGDMPGGFAQLFVCLNK